ncbi:MAG: hypothetical protein AAGB00_09860 [Planctomycetota bacterium]
MRLTLRTLLAYMDGILDPADHDDLARQIEASSDATDLIHRTRDTMRRMKLPAPAVEDKAGERPAHESAISTGGFDANAVAEYLDNTAPAQAVVDLELQCLKSESHLAEVAACHHILTMVLGERAEIDPETRRRMYAIPEVAAAMAQAESATPSATPPPTEQPAAAVTEVPDYLKGSRKPLAIRMLPAVAALLLLGGVSYFAFRTGGFLRGGSITVAGGDTEPSPGQAVGEDPPAAAPAPPAGAASEPAATDPSLGLPSSAPADAGAAPSVAPTEVELPALGDPIAVPPVDGGSVEAPIDGASAEVIEGAIEGPVAETPIPETPPAETPMPGAPIAVAPGDAAVATVGPPAARPTASSPASAPSGPGTAALAGAGATTEPGPPAPAAADLKPAATAPGPLPVGLLSSPQQVLLRYASADESWRRVPLRAAVLTSDRLLSLPTFHPTVTLDSGLNVELVDGALVELGLPGSSLRLEYGRMIVTNTGGEATPLTLAVGSVAASVEIAGRASLAIDARRPFVAGVDPAVEASPLVASLYAPAGGVAWSSPAADFAVSGPSVWKLSGQQVGAAQPLASPSPDGELGWLNGRELTAWEDAATDEVEARLAAGSPIWPQLMEISGSKLKEQRSLAAAASAHVGHFEPFGEALRDEKFKSQWNRVVQTLRDSMARSPATAEAVRQTLIDQYGPERAADLYEMLVGYTDAQIGQTAEQWRVGPLRDLVDRLASDQLPYRVLANYNLEQITGRKGAFSPAGLPLSRGRAVRKLEARLEQGNLTPASGEKP